MAHKDDGQDFWIEGNLKMPKGASKGVLRGDYTNKNQLFGWADITSDIQVRGVAATDPSWAQIGSGPFYAYAFGVNDYVWLTYHVPHDIVPRAPIHFHAHWLTDGTSTNSVKWEFIYTYAKGFNQEAYDTTGTTITAEQAASGTAYQHMVTETGPVTTNLVLDEPDGMIQVRVGRVTNGGSENADTVYLLTADIHYQTTGLIGTRSKAPDFYDI